MIINAHTMKLILGRLNDEIAEECNALGRGETLHNVPTYARALIIAVTTLRFPMSCRARVCVCVSVCDP